MLTKLKPFLTPALLVKVATAILRAIPPKTRGIVYLAVAILGVALTAVIFGLSHSDLIGVTVPPRLSAVFTIALAIVGALARANTTIAKIEDSFYKRFLAELGKIAPIADATPAAVVVGDIEAAAKTADAAVNSTEQAAK